MSDGKFYIMLLRVIVVTLALCGGLVGLKYLLNNRVVTGNVNRKIKVQERVLVAPGKYAVLLTVREQEYLIVTSEKAVTVKDIPNSFNQVLEGELENAE